MLVSQVSPRLPAPRLLLAAAACSLVAGVVLVWSSLAAPEPPARRFQTASDGSPWAGVLAAPGAPATQDSAPPTSASYAAPVTPQAARKPAEADRKVVKAVLPPRRPVAPEQAVAVDSPAPAREPAVQPPPRNRFIALVSEKLPARDTLVRPFQYVGDTIGDWVRKF